MLNVKTLTDTMSRMELPQLQQYAALHKNDPYIVTLALSIANQKKQMKAGQDGQAGMMPQPKVADQQIAQMSAPPPQQMAPQQQMLPEDQGIGTLPARNMQNFAGGGIVAFEEGGDVPGYAEGVFTGGTTARVGQLSYEQLVKLFQTDPELARQAALRAGPAGQRFLEYAQKAARAAGVPAIVGELGTIASIKANRDVARMTPEQRKALSSNPMLSAMSGDAGLAASIQNAPDMEKPTMGYFDQMGKVLQFIPKTLVGAPGDKDSPKGYGLTRLFADGDPAPAPAPAAANAAAAPIPYDPKTATRRSMFVDPPIDKRRSPAASAGPSDASAAPASAAGLPAISQTGFQRTVIPDINVADQLKLYNDAMPKTIVDPMAAERIAINDAASQVAAKQLSAFEQEVQNRKPAFEERLKKLDEKETRVNTMEDRNLNMALVEAGLSMMSGESQYAFVNIGKGAQVGTKAYIEGQAKVEAARDKLDEAKARIEEFRRNEDMMTSKERRTLKNEYENTFISAKKNLLEGIQQQYNLTRGDVTSAIAAKLARESVKAQIGSAENLGIAGIESQQSIAKANMANAANISREDNLSRERVARMPSPLERILRDPVLREAHMESQLGPANVRREMALRTTYYENPQLKISYPTVQDYLLANGVGGQDGVSDGTKVLGSRPGPKP
jgi:hypothetical protein